MTTVRQLYSLQELDQALDRIECQRAEVEQALASRLALEKLETSLKDDQERLQDTQRLVRAQQMDVDSLRERSAQLDTRLYGGDVTNPRELPALEEEATRARDQLKQQDATLQELTQKVTDLQTRCGDLETELAEARAAWQSRQAQLGDQLKGLVSEREGIASNRTRLAAALSPAELHSYESLRQRKGGQAVARVERGLCHACRMSLPTQHLQRVRSGRQTVFCSSCGRMLFLG
ncbi:MAG TPA: C4-type zinc ribbon domain-containing protein [Dehalococcoidia bacterium]|nr:C4-type zinc ribbon domain-containing protein [Dehalococcoidia bacterium]